MGTNKEEAVTSGITRPFPRWPIHYFLNLGSQYVTLGLIIGDSLFLRIKEGIQ
jgi:hypothetical protein